MRPRVCSLNCRAEDVGSDPQTYREMAVLCENSPTTGPIKETSYTGWLAGASEWPRGSRAKPEMIARRFWGLCSLIGHRGRLNIAVTFGAYGYGTTDFSVGIGVARDVWFMMSVAAIVLAVAFGIAFYMLLGFPLPQ